MQKILITLVIILCNFRILITSLLINKSPFNTPEHMESGAALILLLYTGTEGEPVDWRNIGYGSNIPVYRNRIQRIFNRAIHKAKINLLCKVSNDHHPMHGFMSGTSWVLWAAGLINPITQKNTEPTKA